MTAEPVRADADWLALREPADAAARSRELVGLLRPMLPQRDLVIHDMGSGTGAMARWLAPQLPGPQHWILHDRDPELLARAEALPPPKTSDRSAVTIATRQDDISGLDPEELVDADLITASALLDMMTADELDRFVDVCARVGCPILITLTVVGRVDLSPEDPLDHRVMNAFNADQRRDRGAGRLLGPLAAEHATRAFVERGREVTLRPSPWRIGPDHSDLLSEWFTGWLAAATEQAPELLDAASTYAHWRLTAAVTRPVPARAPSASTPSQDSLTVEVHHKDILVAASTSGSEAMPHRGR